MNKISRFIKQLSLFKKLTIFFAINATLMLIFTDITVLTLLNQVSSDTLTAANEQSLLFNSNYNQPIALSLANILTHNINKYAVYPLQLLNAIIFFRNNPQMFTSIEVPFLNPPFISASPPQFSYSKVGTYAAANSSFVSLPAVDDLLSNMLAGTNQIANIKRITIYHLTNQTLFLRTVPLDSNFIPPTIAEVASRFSTLVPGEYSVSSIYNDKYSVNGSALIAIRCLTQVANAHIEIELIPSVLLQNTEDIYYFPSSQFILIKMSSSNIDIFTDTPTSTLAALNLTTGQSKVTIGTEAYLSSTIAAPDVFSIAHSHGAIFTNFRVIVLVSTTEALAPAIAIANFIPVQNESILLIILGWSVVIIFTAIALATFVGDEIFSNLKATKEQLTRYIQCPQTFHKVCLQLRERKETGILKELVSNLLRIIERIEVRKIEKADRVKQNYHPLNIGEQSFQKRMGLKDAEIMDGIKKLILMHQRKI